MASRTRTPNAIAGLAEAEILIPLGESRRNRAWDADGLLDLIVDLESGVS